MASTGLDPAKDQSYFLFTLTQEQLQQVIFPVGMLENQRQEARIRIRAPGGAKA